MFRLRTPFYDKPDGAADGAAGGPPVAGAGTDDEGGFVSESASVAFTQAPTDTTEGVTETASASAEAPVVEGSEAHAGAEAAAVAETQATAPEAGSKVAVAGTPSKKKAKPASERIAEIQREIGILTGKKHSTATELQRDEARLATVRAEIADLEKKKGAPPPAAAPGPPAEPAAAKADPKPAFPRYRDFATDEEYEAAVAKYETDSTAWYQRQADARLDGLKKEITDGVEARFTSADQELARQTAVSTMASTLQKVSATFEDWDAKADALREIRSHWRHPKTGEEIYDPSNPTPFLNDLSQTMLMTGREEGGQLLHWLGSDPERAQRLADLLPTRPLRDALVNAPSVIPLLDFFSTEVGAVEFERLKQMHPIQMMQAVGALFVRLQPAPRGSGQTAHPITEARPSARPPAGTPGARAETPPDKTGAAVPFEDWMAAEDARELAEKKRQFGLPA